MQAIAAIDKQITANHRELQRREKIKPLSAASWQSAWDKHPKLWVRERDLYRQRGQAQQERDEKAAKDAVRRIRYSRPKKCPTCGCHTLAV